ncbi:BppU family phage baseplate upper protein [Bacillus thuringiensis]
MAVKTYTFTLDLAHSIPVPSIVVRVGDYDTNAFNVTITNEGEPFDLTGWTPQFEVRLSNGAYIKDDGKQFKNMVVVDSKKGMISYTLISAASSVVGTVDTAYFSFTKPDASLENPIDMVSTRNFKYKVIADAATGASGVAEHYISQIEILEWQVKQSVSSMQAKIDKTVTDANNKVNSSLTVLDKKINDFITKSDGQMSNFQKKLNDLDTQLKNMDVVKKSGDTMTGALTFTSDMQCIFKKVGKKSWATHRPSNDGFILVPSKTVDGTDWDWDNGICFSPTGTINIKNNEVATQKYINDSWKQKHPLTTADGVSIDLADGTDLNTVIKNGFYRGTKLVNTPTSDAFWYIQVYSHSNPDYACMQTAYSLNNSNNKSLYVRKKAGGVWTNWERHLTSSDLGKWLMRGQDLLVYDKRALVGTPDGDKLVINFGNDFKNGVDVIGILKNNGKEVLTKSSNDTDWMNLTLINGTTVDVERTPKYKCHNNVVYIVGAVANIKDGMTIANIPSGLKPPKDCTFVVTYLGTDNKKYFGELNVRVDGRVSVDWMWNNPKSAAFCISYPL